MALASGRKPAKGNSILSRLSGGRNPIRFRERTIHVDRGWFHGALMIECKISVFADLTWRKSS